MSGHDMAIAALDLDDVVRFMGKVDRTVDCWVWTGATFPTGYGRFSAKRRPTLAHRVAFFIANDKLPGELVVCHRCDDKRCVNPAHLFLGTIGDNNTDRHRKGRDPRGSTHGNSKLNEAIVQEARRRHSAGETCYRLARCYGVDENAVRQAVQRKTWKHVS